MSIFAASIRLSCAHWLRVLVIAALMGGGYGTAVHASPSFAVDAAVHAQAVCDAAENDDIDQTLHHDESGACCDPSHCSTVAVLLTESATIATSAWQWTPLSADVPSSSFDIPPGPPPNA